MDISYLLSKTKLFEGIETTALNEIAQFTERQIFEPMYNQDMVIISANEPHEPDLFLIISGEVSLDIMPKTMNIASTKQEKSLEHEVFGELSWVLKQKRLSDIHTNSRVVLLRIHGQKLQEYLTIHPEVALLFWQRIFYATARRLSETFLKNKNESEWNSVFKF
ncbi:MAG: cyclic nucleotide-binding domain-containing protein [Magnetococcus sp. YQC-5]